MSDLQEKLKVRSQIDKKIEVIKKNLEGSKKIVEELTSRLATLEEENRDLKLLLNKAREDNDARGAHEIVDLKNMDKAQLIAKIEEVQNDFYDDVEHSFQKAVAQIKVKTLRSS
jgi:glycine cleavage system regulatory protein